VSIDPVCKMAVDRKTAKLKSDFEGQTYYFCSPACQKDFEANPEKYLMSTWSIKGCGGGRG